MPAAARNANPFAMMLDPQAVLARVAHSERLGRLQRRVCRPLDRPMLGRAASASADQAAYDSEIDSDLDNAADEAADWDDTANRDDRAA